VDISEVASFLSVTKSQSEKDFWCVLSATAVVTFTSGDGGLS